MPKALETVGKIVIDTRKKSYENATEGLDSRIRNEKKYIEDNLRNQKRRKEEPRVLHYIETKNEEIEGWTESFNRCNRKREKELWKRYSNQKKRVQQNPISRKGKKSRRKERQRI
jgi:hypothetical protein